MKVEVKIKATADELYSLLMNSAKHDIEQATNQNISLEDLISGYTYEKKLTNKLGKQGSAIGTLTKVQKPYTYEAEFKSSRGINKLAYHLEPLDAGYLNVTYSEAYEPINKIADLNFKIMNFFYKKSTRKRMIRLIQMMEAHIGQGHTQ
jgi:hypothetical protein